MKWRSRFVLVLLTLAAGLALRQQWQQRTYAPASQSPSAFHFEEPLPDTQARIVLTEENGEVPHVRVCEGAACRPVAGPGLEESAPVRSSGTAWFYYTRERQLIRRDAATGESHTIIGPTSLTAPRDLFLSPDGGTLAFFLDNIHDPERELTELWLYDDATRNIRVIAENIFRPDIHSPVYWNSSGTHLWFIADTAPRTAPDRLELVLVSTREPGMRAAFANVDWPRLAGHTGAMPIDVSADGSSVAFATTARIGRGSVLSVVSPRGSDEMSVRGTIAYLAWLADGSLVYIIQEERTFTAWRQREGIHQFVANRPGILRTAARDGAGTHLALATSATPDSTVTELFTLHVAEGVVRSAGALAGGSGQLAITSVSTEKPASRVAGITTELDDGELVAFIERHQAEITGMPTAQLVRLIMTDAQNTVFVDYRAGTEEKRLLLTVHDAIHTEWSIKGRYETVGGEWRPEAPVAQEPHPKRLYEWEDSVKQWILKVSY
jgi:hypothetical protein